MKVRQREFYNLLVEVYTTLGEDYWVSKETLAEAINFLLQRTVYIVDLRPESHDVCSMFNRDMDEINSSEEYEKHILLQNNHFKIATREELLEEFDRRQKKLIREATKMGIINRKLRSHGQGQIFDIEAFKERYFD